MKNICIEEHVDTWIRNWVALPDDVDLEACIEKIKKFRSNWTKAIMQVNGRFKDVEHLYENDKLIEMQILDEEMNTLAEV